jgi:hypothetical protein
MKEISIQEIAFKIFENGGRARDCGVRDEVKRWGKLADEILERLAKIEIKHLSNLGSLI